jgi:DNA-binding NarL/FixJ family response regulator
VGSWAAVPDTTRVFHCDDSSAFRVLVREMLIDLGGIEMVGEAGDLDEALVRLPEARPDVVLVDLFEYDRASDLLALLRAAAPGAQLLIYSGMPEHRVPPGADGHLHKSVPFPELHRAILQAAARA